MSKLRYLFSVLAATLLLSGCNVQSASELFCLPGRSTEQNDLQTVIRIAMEDMEYSAPLNGTNRQSVQAADLNGDGQMEYIVFAKNLSAKPLHIFIFSGDGAHYMLLDTIECTGSSFDRVEYVQMDNALGCEIVVGRQVGDQAVRAVSVYSLIADHMETFLTAGYTRFLTAQLDGGGKNQLLVLCPGTGHNGVAEVYSMQDRQMLRLAQIPISQPAENIRHVTGSVLQDGIPAVYTTSAVSGGDSIVTDVLIWRDDRLWNLTGSDATLGGESTLRSGDLVAFDIDGDGVLELPEPIQTQSDLAEGQYIIRWYSLCSDGSRMDKVWTYHNFSGGWYLELKADLAPRIDVVTLGSSYEFRIWDREFTQWERLLNIYVLTGQRREEQAVVNNRFVLQRGESIVYSADLSVTSYAYGLTKASLIGDFHLTWEEGMRE